MLSSDAETQRLQRSQRIQLSTSLALRLVCLDCVFEAADADADADAEADAEAEAEGPWLADDEASA